MNGKEILKLLNNASITCKNQNEKTGCSKCPLKDIVEGECLFKKQPKDWDNKYIAEELINLENYVGKTIILDTETTGIGEDDEILQLSIIDENESTLYNEYFKPRYKTSWPRAEAVNHISPEMVNDKPTIYEKQNEIQKIMSEVSTVIGYNVEFDLRMLRRAGIYLNPFAEKIDVMKRFADYYGDYDPKHKRYKYKSLKLCAETLGYEENNLHDSLEDCKATLFAYKKLNEIY